MLQRAVLDFIDAPSNEGPCYRGNARTAVLLKYLLNNWGKSAPAPVSGASSPRNIEMMPFKGLCITI
jgi:hypothetical protein